MAAALGEAAPARAAAGLACEIVVPVFNGHDATRRCLEALQRHTQPGHGIVLVDDASTDPRIAGLLSAFAARHGNARVVANERNLGFAGAVERGIAQARGDVVVLNSDAEVGPGWLEGLLRCRDSDAAIGIVCPLSNKATILSLPGVAELFTSADGTTDVAAIASCIARTSRREYPRIPTAVGFCMLVRRAVLERAGPLDPLYGRGYGEECDLSMRALDLGYEIACADDVYVHHAGEASFGEVAGIDEAREANRIRLERRWPDYAPGVRAWAVANPLRRAAERINAAAERERLPGRPRVLEVLHRLESRGGIEEHTRALVNFMRRDVAFTLALPEGPRGAWTDFHVARLAPHLRVARLNPERMRPGLRVIGHAADAADASVEDAFRGLVSGGFDVVHFQSLVGWNSLRLPVIARESGARVVVSAHDFALMCADYNMMTGPRDLPCGRSAARGADSGCVACLRGKSEAALPEAAPSISGYLESRFAAAAEAVAAADVIVCPSEYVAERMRRGFGATCTPKLRVIGHGVADLPLLPQGEVRPMLRVAFLGRFGGRKGAGLMIEAARRLAGQRVLLEAWGPTDAALEGHARAAGIVLRGAYDPSDLARILRGIDLVLLPSTMEETFCLALSEAQRLGIPVAAPRAGAIPERVRDGETGFLFPHGDVGAIAALLTRLRDDRGALARVAERLKQERPKTIEANAAEYLALYRELASADGPRKEMPAEAGGTRGDLVREHLRFPRQRARTPLGGAAYDRWLARQAVEPSPPGAADLETIVLETASVDDATLGALNRTIADARSDWIVLQEAGDTLAPDAFATLARAIAAHPDAELLYACSDQVSTRGERYDPAFLPRFSPELLRHRPYLSGLCVLRRAPLIERGGLRAAGWPGVTDLALRLAEEGRAHAVVALRELLVHRLDLNVAAEESAAARTRHGRVVADHFRRTGVRAVHLPSAPDAPAMWSRVVPAAPVSVFLAATAAPERASACIAALVVSERERIGDIYLDLDAARCEAIAKELSGHGLSIRIRPVGEPAGSPLARAIRNAGTGWIALVDVRCSGFRAGWLERLEQGIADAATALVAPALRGPDEARIPGWEIAGGGRWAIAGAPPKAEGQESLATLYDSPREVAVASGRLALLRRDAVLAAHALDEIDAAGPFAMPHLCFALRTAGFDLLSRPFIAADFAEPASAWADELVPVAKLAVPAEAAWMRARWPEALADDPCYHPALRISGEGFVPEEGFAPRVAGAGKPLRVCAFPFDRWGSGEVRVRQPSAALERSGAAQVLMMGEHDTGRAPNRTEWQRLAPDAVLAHNFFHNYQLASLQELPGALKVLGLDDLLTHLPKDNPYAATIYPDIAERIARAVSLCDRIVVSTAPLAEAFGRGAADVRVIPNAIDAERWKGLANKPAGGARPRVGWAGARQHAADLRLLEPVLRATWRDIDWIFLGMCPPELREMAAEVHEMVPVARYPETLAALALDAAVAPLEDHPFNRAKSNLKLLEYGFLGIPVVASDIEPYRGAPVTCVPNRDAAWIDAVRGYATDRDAARAAGERLRQWVASGHTLAASIPAWTRALDPAH